jgi:hypothetical protein
VSFAYHEQLTTNYTRLTDEAWTAQLASSSKPNDVTWMTPVFGQ